MPNSIQAEDLKKLPLRAIVAFAARCARRVQPLYELPAQGKKLDRYIASVNDAVIIAERFAVDADDASDAATSHRGLAADIAAQVAIDTYTAGASPDTARASYTSRAARAAASAASAAMIAAETRSGLKSKFAPFFVAERAADAERSAAAAADAVVANNSTSVRIAAQLDYERLLALNLGHFRDLGEPIDATEAGPLGPLWPGEPPTWYTARMGRKPSQGISLAASDQETLELPCLRVSDASEWIEPPTLEIHVDPGNASKETRIIAF
jgi:hypothetical protein